MNRILRNARIPSRCMALIAGLAFLGWAASPAAAETIKVGCALSTTGPTASIGIPGKNTLQLTPTTVGEHKLELIILDDGSDTTNARKNVEKLVTEHKVDVIIGPSLTPTSLAVIEIAGRSGTPTISQGASERIISPIDKDRYWMFKIPYSDFQFAEAIAEHLKATGIKRIAYIGNNNAYGESWAVEMANAAKKRDIAIVANERYDQNDTTATAQILKIIAAKPEAVVIGAAGTPAVLPQAALNQRGFKGPIYQTAGVINNDFLRVGGKDVEGTIIPSGPLVVADQLPDSHPVKAEALRYKKVYEAVHGPNTVATFGGNAWDSMLLLQAAVPVALATGTKPGTPEFRKALRDAIENTRGIKASLGVMNFSDKSHLAYNGNTPNLITIRNGRWTLLQ